jgi:hypothetical protein
MGLPPLPDSLFNGRGESLIANASQEVFRT